MSRQLTQASYDYQLIEKVILFLERNFQRQPNLDEIASQAHLSEFHFQRLFTRWAGVSPKRFLQFLTKEYAKELLEHSADLLQVTFESGLSSPGRLHDLFIQCEAVTPGEYKTQGDGLQIEYGFHATPFGECLLAKTFRGICGLKFVGKGGRRLALEELKDQWDKARLVENARATQPFIDKIFSNSDRTQPLTLLLKGTNFQIKVWEALLKIPSGRMMSYGDIAKMIGQPGAARAVGRAIGDNPIGYLIPCHRVIQNMGVIGDYHWGKARKKAILGWEAAHSATEMVA